MVQDQPPTGHALLHRLIYVSRSLVDARSPEMAALARTALERNSISGVTGHLYHDGILFAQVLEGLDDDVSPIYASIQADRRHHQVKTLSYEPVEARTFGAWHMGFSEPDAPDRSIGGLFGPEDFERLGEAHAAAVFRFLRNLSRPG